MYSFYIQEFTPWMKQGRSKGIISEPEFFWGVRWEGNSSLFFKPWQGLKSGYITSKSQFWGSEGRGKKGRTKE